MLTIWGRRQRFCDRHGRREFLRIGAFGGAFSLAQLCSLSAGTAGASSLKRCSRKAAILVYLPGGPSHLDTYDLKPEAPPEIRGEFSAIKTTVPGIQICELLPRQAALMHKLAVIRSVTGAADEHSDAQVMSGWTEMQNRNIGRPSLGAVISKLRASDVPGLPPFVSLRGLSKGLEPGSLGVAHRAFTPSGPGMANLKLPSAVTLERLEDRRALLARFDRFRGSLDVAHVTGGLDALTARAIEVLTSGAVRKALDLGLEEPRVRDRYGKATQFLTARRLVEAGVGCVTLATGGWDTHGNNFRTLRRQLPELDVAVSALVEDLYQRGLDKEVVLVMWGEFGRTPKINAAAGRDHWPNVMSCLIVGGGLKMGQVIGSTSSRGEYAKDRPYHVQNVLATICHALGIDPTMTFENAAGRPVSLLEDHRRVEELV
jgi:hypothetical protein